MSEIKVNSIKGVGASAAAITVNNTDGTCTANITSNGNNQLANRNKIINGSMMIHQRGDASATGSAAYLSCDRFLTNNGSGAQVAVTKSTDTPDGFSASTKWDCTTADSSVAAGEYFIIQQRIEGQNVQDFAKGTSSAKQFAVSFYIKATKTGVYTVELEDVDNSRHCSKTITVSDTNWNRYTLIYPADTTGAFNNDNGNSLSLNFWLIAGSNFTSGTLQSSAWGTGNTTRASSSNVNGFDSTSNDFLLTGVQLEVGSVATDFEHKSFAQELALCQRYFQQYVNPCITGVIPDNGSKAYSLGLQFQTRMRAVPTLTIANAGTGGNVSDGQSTQTIASLNAADRNVDGASIYLNLNGDLGDFRPACTGLNDSTTNTTTYSFTAEL